MTEELKEDSPSPPAGPTCRHNGKWLPYCRGVGVRAPKFVARTRAVTRQEDQQAEALTAASLSELVEHVKALPAAADWLQALPARLNRNEGAETLRDGRRRFLHDGAE